MRDMLLVRRRRAPPSRCGPARSKWRGELCEPLTVALRGSALDCLGVPSRSPRWRRRNTEKRCEDAPQSESTSCKIHGKQPAAFREALGVRTRRRVAFNQNAALNSACSPRSPARLDERDLAIGVGRFPKKEEFRIFSFSVFQVSSNV